MLAVDGDPFLGDHRRGQPRPKTEEMIEQRMKIHTAVCLAAVQVQRDREDRQLRKNQQHDQQSDPSETCQASNEKVVQ
jgi:hypothetical protein